MKPLAILSFLVIVGLGAHGYVLDGWRQALKEIGIFIVAVVVFVFLMWIVPDF